MRLTVFFLLLALFSRTSGSASPPPPLPSVEFRAPVGIEKTSESSRNAVHKSSEISPSKERASNAASLRRSVCERIVRTKRKLPDGRRSTVWVFRAPYDVEGNRGWILWARKNGTLVPVKASTKPLRSREEIVFEDLDGSLRLEARVVFPPSSVFKELSRN